MEKKWNYEGNNPNWKTNYECKISDSGLWRIESEKFGKNIHGKNIFIVKLKTGANSAPTFADQNNFMTGLLEVEWRNDTFKFPDGSTRCSSWNKSPTFNFRYRLEKFKNTLQFMKDKYNGQTKLDGY